MHLVARTSLAVTSICNAVDAQELDAAVRTGLEALTIAPRNSSAGASQDPSQIAHASSILKNAAAARAAELAAGSQPSAPDNAKLRALNELQNEILELISQGKSNAEIGIVLGRTKRTVDYHVLEILKKLEVRSRAQAAAVYGAANLR